MTISSQTRKAGPFVGNDVTTAFPFAFKVFATSDLYVVRLDTATGIETVLALTTDYTVSLNADQDANPGGTVTLLSALATGKTLTLTSSLQYLQQTDLTNQGGFYPKVITNALDRLTILIQQLLERASRSLSLPVSTSGVSTELPTPTPGAVIAFNYAADALTAVPVGNLGNFAWSATSYVDRFNGTGAQTAFTLTAAPGGENATQVYISGVYQQKNTYSISGGTITFSVAPPAGTGNIEVVSAVVPTDFQQLVTDAETAATTATAQAGIATTQAGTATTQAGIATTAAGTATTQAGLATTAANNAAASYDLFDDRFLGAKAADPTLDNDGNALAEGAIYWNTTDKKLRIYTGTAWTDVGVPAPANFTADTFSGTGAQTAFTLSASAVSAQATLVFISGVRQVPTTDYTVSGSTLTFTSAPPSGTNNVTVLTASMLAIGTPADGTVTTAKLAAGVASGLTTVTAVASDHVVIADASDGGNVKKALVSDIAALATTTQIQPISASVGSNALTISASALSLDFRSTTLGSGTVTRVSGTPANLVISSGSTLGTINGQQSRIAVLAINNAGTIELAAVNIGGGNNLDETTLISTTAEGGAGAADSASVIYSTTARSNVAFRVIGYVESTQATAGTWATAPSTIQGSGGQVRITGYGSVRLNTANGYGSTNTKIRRFTNVVTNQGSDITYADSATLGASFTINTPGVYSISYCDQFSAAGTVGLSLNTTAPTTAIDGAVPVAEVLSMGTSASSTYVANASWSGFLPAGSVIRPHTQGSTTGSGGPAQFTIARVS